MVLEEPQNDFHRLLNKMFKQSQRQYTHNIKAIINTNENKDKKNSNLNDDKKMPKPKTWEEVIERKKKKLEPRPKCICPKNITKTKKKKGSPNLIKYTRKHYNGYQVTNCPVHSNKTVL